MFSVNSDASSTELSPDVYERAVDDRVVRRHRCSSQLSATTPTSGPRRCLAAMHQTAR